MSVPRIRVDGFNMNFEKKNFGEIVRSESTRMYIKSVVSDLGKYEVIQQGDIPILGYSDDQPFAKYKSVILFGDHTLSLYRPKAPFLLATDGIKILQSTILKRDYLYYLTQNYIPKSQGYKRHFSVLKQVFVNYSQDSSEQTAIGSLFRTLDDLLSNYKDNLVNYQSLKATMLSKMFPKAGQTVPEIRLDGFEGEWVEKRLKDISKRVTRKNNDLVSERALTISAQFGLIDQEEFFQKKIASKDVSGYYLIKKGEFAYNKSYSTGYPLGAIKRLDKYENGVLSTLYILFKAVDVDSDYLAHYYESDKWHREVSMCAAEGARNHGLLNIAPADFFNTRLVVPKELEEQRAIGAYFSNLDSLISAHQEKISQLETLKKKLLHDMFI